MNSTEQPPKKPAPEIKRRAGAGVEPFGPTNEPGTCLWCGRKLRACKPGLALRIGTEHRGDYGDNAFCGLRCGYAFGVAMAGFGRRLQPPGG